MSANSGFCHSATGKVGGGRRCQNTVVGKFPFLTIPPFLKERRAEKTVSHLLRLEAFGNGDSHSHTPEAQYRLGLERKGSDSFFFPSLLGLPHKKKIQG